MRFLKAEHGFSMVQGMVISAVLAGSALMVTRMMSTQKMSQRSAETKDQIGELHKQIFATLQNREHCLTTLSTPLATVATNSTYPVPDIKTKPETTGAGQTMFRVNTGSPTGDMYMNGNVRINSISLRTNADLSLPQPLVINYVRLEGKNANGVRSGMGFGGKSISRTINVRLQRASAASTTINGCYAVETNADSDSGQGNSDLNKDFCERLGTGTGEAQSLFTWDETRNTCVLKDTVCPNKTVFEGVNSTGLPICRPFEDYVPYFLAPGTNPCPPSKAGVKLIYDAGTNKVNIQCY